MAILNIEKANKILHENNLLEICNKDEDAPAENKILAIYLYLKLIHTFHNEIESMSGFNKILNVKLIRWLSCKILYESNSINLERSIIGLRLAKDLIDEFLEQGFIQAIEGEEKIILRKEYFIPSDQMSRYVISDIGILLYKELEKCLISYQDFEIAFIKTMILVPEVTSKVEYRNNFNENLISTLLDYIYYGGLHV